jgi:hypothetical protein
MRLAALLTLALLLVSGPVAAQEVEKAPTPEVATAAPAPETPCEIHVFPAERFQAMTTGWLGGGLIEAAIYADRDRDNRTQMAASLDPVIQLEALRGMDLAGLLALRPSRIITHETPLDRKTINKISTRRAESASSCYAEVIVADMLYQKNALLGRTLQTLFMVRDFGAQADRPRIYKSWGGNPLKKFPPKEGEDFEAAAQELVDTFAKNFEEFAANAKRSAARAGSERR